MFAPCPFPDHALLDSGGGRKLERFGPVVLDRPDPQALWRRRQDERAWAAADLAFERIDDRRGRWRARAGAHELALGRDPSWQVRFDDATLVVRPTPFKHVGVFPEQAANWRWVGERAQRFEAPRLLNLFGYTGAASVLAAQAGYAVTHVDASKTSLAWARENAAGSGLGERALRIVLDDALAFARRELRRGARYEGILVDPPHYGRGPKGEVWRFEEGLAPLLEACAELAAERAFLVLSSYAIGYSPLAFTNVLAELPGGTVAADELVVPEEDGGRFLPCGFCARWERGLDG